MLCCDMSHKVLRTQTAYQLIKDVMAQKPADMQGSVLEALLGAVVLTRYNNKCYKVDDIDWAMSKRKTLVSDNVTKYVMPKTRSSPSPSMRPPTLRTLPTAASGMGRMPA